MSDDATGSHAVDETTAAEDDITILEAWEACGQINAWIATQEGLLAARCAAYSTKRELAGGDTIARLAEIRAGIDSVIGNLSELIIALSEPL